jgi:hypothetical protein
MVEKEPDEAGLIFHLWIMSEHSMGWMRCARLLKLMRVVWLWVAQAWLIQQPGITSVIIGAKTLEQLEDNLRAAKLIPAPEELEILNSVRALSVEYPAWMETFQNRD